MTLDLQFKFSDHIRSVQLRPATFATAGPIRQHTTFPPQPTTIISQQVIAIVRGIFCLQGNGTFQSSFWPRILKRTNSFSRRLRTSFDSLLFDPEHNGRHGRGFWQPENGYTTSSLWDNSIQLYYTARYKHITIRESKSLVPIFDEAVECTTVMHNIRYSNADFETLRHPIIYR